MKVRQLIRALAKHDLDMEVVMPAYPDHFMTVAGVEEDVFTANPLQPEHLRLAELQGEGALVAVRLSVRPASASH